MSMFVTPKWYVFFDSCETYFYIGRCTKKDVQHLSMIFRDLVFVNPMDIEQFISDYVCFCGGERIGK